MAPRYHAVAAATSHRAVIPSRPMRRRLALVPALLVAACNPVFGLDPTTLRDAGLASDADGTCATAPTGLPDEDGDGVRDACDPCPQLDERGAGSGDEDGDGVRDGCDPRPGARDQLHAFLGFADLERPGELAYRIDDLSAGQADWSTIDGDLRISPLAPDSDALAELAVGRATVTVDTIYRLERDPAPKQGIGVWASIDPDSADRERPNGIDLMVATLGADTVEPTVVLNDWPTALAQTATAAPAVFSRGARVRLVLTCEQLPAPRCVGSVRDLISGEKYGLDTDAQGLTPTLRPGAVGLRAFAVPAAFEYLAVYVAP
jgi:hypothetical protein